MNQSLTSFFLAVLLFITCFSCVKEYSIEKGTLISGVATGSLLDSSGNCQHIAVHGYYPVDSVLTDSNYILVSVNFSSIGKYKIYSDTINGFWFADSGYTVNSGNQLIKIRAHGIPALPVASSFNLFFNTNFCAFTVYYIPPISNTDYFPTTFGSYWNYSKNGSATDTLRYTALNSFLFNPSTNYTYELFLSDLKDSALYRKDGLGNYFTYASLDDSSYYPVDYIFLKDYAVTGNSWTSITAPSSRVGIDSVKMNFTIMVNGISVLYNGTVYNNVIEVKEDILMHKNGQFSLLSPNYTYYIYYAKGIGRIHTNYPSIPYSFTLLNYRVY